MADPFEGLSAEPVEEDPFEGLSGEPVDGDPFAGLSAEPVEQPKESLGKKALSFGKKAITPFETPRKALQKLAQPLEDAIGKIPKEITDVAAFANPLLTPVPFMRPGRVLSPTNVADALAPTPLDAATLATGALFKLGGTVFRTAGKAVAATEKATAAMGPVPKQGVQALDDALAVAGDFSGIFGDPVKKSLPDKILGTNLSKLSLADEGKSLLMDLTEANKGIINEARRGVQTNTETLRLADQVGMTVEDYVRLRGKAPTAEEAVASRQLLSSVTENTVEIARQVAAGAKPVSEGIEAVVQNLNALKLASGLRAESGRALQSYKIVVGSSEAKKKSLQAIMNAWGGKEVTEELLSILAKVDPSDTRGVNMLIRGLVESKTSDKAFEVWRNFLLSGIPTHVANITSNALTLLSRPIVERPLAAGIDLLRSAATRTPREVFFGEAAKDVVGAAVGIREGVRKALTAFSDEIAEGAAKLDIPSNVAKSQAIKGPLGKVVRIPQRLLFAMDEFFKTVSKSGDLYAQAYGAAAKKGLSGADLVADMTKSLANPSKASLEKASNEAAYRTFQAPLGNIGRRMIGLRDAIPGARYIVPFMTTPINVAKFGLERTPLNLIRLASKIGKGDLRGAEFSKELAKPAMGSLIAMPIAQMASEGFITGGGPADPAKRSALRASGWQPYSVKIGNKYVSYSRLEPLSMIIGLTADYVELFDLMDSGDAASKIGLAISQNISNKTFLQGITSLLNAVSDPERYGEKWIQRLAGSAVPTVVANVAGAVDPFQRRADSIGGAIRRRVPGLSTQELVLRDMWGQPVLRQGNPVERLVSPFYRSTIVNDPSTQEIVRLGIGIQPLRQTLGSVEISDSEFDELQEEAGRLAKQRIDRLVNSPVWEKLSDDKKEDIIRDSFSQARRVAKRLIIPDLALRERAAASGKKK